MKVLVACEFSGIVRDAFRSRGHEAWSCDLIPSERDGHHLIGDVRSLLAAYDVWDLMIAFPPCTYLCRSGARWWPERLPEQEEALEFVRMLMEAPVDKIAIENPIGCISTRVRRPDQIIQPWQFGHGEVKATCLWLKGLQKLEPTKTVEGRHQAIYLAPDSRGRQKFRSRTYQGIADAMAEQWG